MRFAIYYAPPPSSPLHQLGSRWLGRDAVSGEALAQPAALDLAPITREPRRYGFHATLKPPFALKDGTPPASLEAAVEALAHSIQPFEIVLALRPVDGFLALVPDRPCGNLGHLAEACVRDLDRFRQPASEEDIARRRAAGLSPRQDEYLGRWGYPYVFDEFRFHMTLSRRLSPSKLEDVTPLAEDHFGMVIGHPITIDSVSMFVEPRASADFTIHRRFPFQSPRAKASP
ncbi:DUF1045 domain-containing protein [Aestuariivirga sp.]|uniref:DUF1045 domain-containing protein n=1 Tax=Aestuariivirga sp. TaxID=2650926 RepID=UPI003593E1AB